MVMQDDDVETLWGAETPVKVDSDRMKHRQSSNKKALAPLCLPDLACKAFSELDDILQKVPTSFIGLPFETSNNANYVFKRCLIKIWRCDV